MDIRWVISKLLKRGKKRICELYDIVLIVIFLNGKIDSKLLLYQDILFHNTSQKNKGKREHVILAAVKTKFMQ